MGLPAVHWVSLVGSNPYHMVNGCQYPRRNTESVFRRASSLPVHVTSGTGTCSKQYFSARDPLMSFVQPAYILCNILSPSMIKNSHLILENASY
jgi:hypothetical protein